MVTLASQATWVGSDLAEKIALAILGALLGLASAYLIDRIKTRREPRKQLSWDVAIEAASLKVTAAIKRQVRMLYANVEVDALSHVRVLVVNTGNRVVKNHDLRFTFPENVPLLDDYLDPKPDPELGVERTSATRTGDQDERKYHIAHLERGESVTFNFVVAAETNALAAWRPRSFNGEGDVDFEQRETAVVKDDLTHVVPFTSFAFLFIALPPAIGALLGGSLLGQLETGLLRLILLAFIAPHVRPVARVLERALAKRIGTTRPATDVRAWDGGSIVVVNDSANIETVTFGPKSDNG